MNSNHQAVTRSNTVEILELGRQFRQRERSPVDVVEELLGDIRKRDSVINSYLTVIEEASFAAARDAERRILAGSDIGPLTGVPIALKDVILTKGIRTTANSRILEGYVPNEDADVVSRLKSAGAIIIGKTSCYEYAHGGPSFDLPWPPARNPWNLDRGTGGSSSGSGAALAAGLAYGALGTDTGGSIRHPAAFCGVSGLKPTFGLVSVSGVIQNSPSFDNCGPMARTSLDCGLILDVMLDEDADYTGAARADLAAWLRRPDNDLRELKIGVIWNFLEESVGTSHEVHRNLDACEKALAEAGATTERIDVRPSRDYYAVKVTIAESELYEFHCKNLRTRAGDYGEDFLVRCLPASFFTKEDHILAAWLQRQMQTEWNSAFRRFHVIITAGSLDTAPRFDEHRSINFWQTPMITTPFNTWPGPCLSARSGFGADGLPLAVQIAGRPYEDALVLKVGHVIEQMIGAGSRVAPAICRPSTNTCPTIQLPASDASSAQIAECALRAEGLPIEERYIDILTAVLPHVNEMRNRIRTALQDI